MMHRYTGAFALSLLLLPAALMAQNLVPNPSFEVQDTCPAVSQIELAHPWNSATLGTPDLFNSTCSQQNLTAHTGVGSGGVFLIESFANSREYLQAPLTSPLVAGQHYCVSFWVKRSNYRYASNRIGAYFSVGALAQQTTGVLALTPQVDNPTSHMLLGNSWQEVSGAFTASGGETHIIIGSFANDDQTDTVVANASNQSRVSYYAIDDVSVTACTVGIDEVSGEVAALALWPSPATSIVTVSGGAMDRAPDVHDLTGALVPVPGLRTGKGSYELDVADLAAGIYLVTVRTSSGTSTRRLVVQH